VSARFRQVEGQDEQGNQDLLDVLREPRLASRSVRPLDVVEEFGSGDPESRNWDGRNRTQGAQNEPI
jgi:hypothetical protein